MSALPTQVGALAQRSVMRTARQPASAIPPLLFPVALMLLNSGGLHASTELPGFPTDSFLAFALAVPFIQGALFSTMNAGTDLARDIQTGFFSRLSLTPVRGGALLAGQLAGIVALGVLQAVFYIAVGLLLGVHFAAGPAGIAPAPRLRGARRGRLRRARLVRSRCAPARARRSRALFPLLFVFLFISSMNTPRNLIAVGWFQFLASINPISYLIECIRSLIITGWDAEALALGFGIAIVLCDRRGRPRREPRDGKAARTES